MPNIMEFHISKSSRDHYSFDQSLFTICGNVIFADFHAAQQFSQKLNQEKQLDQADSKAFTAGQINAMGLIDEILHFVISRYRKQFSPSIMDEALEWLESLMGRDAIDKTLVAFTAEFPPITVYQGKISIYDYLNESSPSPTSSSNRATVLEEMLMLWIANENPAFCPYQELFDDHRVAENSPYLQIISNLQLFFDTKPFFGPDNQNLIDMLRSPALVVPFSLFGQLSYIQRRWGYLLDELMLRILLSQDIIKEEDRIRLPFSGPISVNTFADLDPDYERFSPDRDWMPNLVLIAKNTYVWLDQLSKAYHQPINQLDQVPEAELKRLSDMGFTGLWLIGLWERSPASRRIKQMRGNPEAVASAYSIFEYAIAQDLGGENAFQVLRSQAWQYGIRLASDMVPNHMGIDSRWVIEHPDWFISLDHSPFPSYTFDGENLSWDQRVGIYLEDHYYNGTDAAVVFKRVDFHTGDVKYIYHGNDGTSMPWNDTAQLNYLIPEVRQAVIQTILNVARQFPIIRFDAAMTLAKRHYQRLWYPEPGAGGDIPSRSHYGLTTEQFNQLFPIEFWRDVVDRVSQEAPDTLLLAEAFWLMEGYFVRTLGMHRVYNSAFMNMLRDEKNQEFRQVIKNTQEFDPDILKRYVNFMNNPDERTAIDQFGDGDKYFGICTMLATLPGLPMFGHGQIEGYKEKYGMEYRRAYWEEQPDQTLVDRHLRQISPLLRKRYRFANANQFLLYDFYNPSGSVNEDVFAYSNQAGDEISLVVYNNRYANASGWIRTSAAYLLKDNRNDSRTLHQKSLAQGLGIRNNPSYFTILRDHLTNLEYIRNNQDIHQNGLFIELDAYYCQVFLDIWEVCDNQNRDYERLAKHLAGRGVRSIDQALRELRLQPFQHAFQELLNIGQIQWLTLQRDALLLGDKKQGSQLPPNLQSALVEVTGKSVTLLERYAELSKTNMDVGQSAQEITDDIAFLFYLPSSIQDLASRSENALQPLLDVIQPTDVNQFFLDKPVQPTDHRIWATAIAWIIVRRLAMQTGLVGAGTEQSAAIRSQWWKDYLLDKIISQAMIDMHINAQDAALSASLIKLLLSHDGWTRALESDSNKMAANSILKDWLSDADFQYFVNANPQENSIWVNKELLEIWLGWSALISLVSAKEYTHDLETTFNFLQQALTASKLAGYRVDQILSYFSDKSNFNSA